MTRDELVEHYQKLIEDDQKKIVKKTSRRAEVITSSECLSFSELGQYFDYTTIQSIYCLINLPSTRKFFKFANFKKDHQTRPFRCLVIKKIDLPKLFKAMPLRLKKKLKENINQ